jgi:heme A synthase
MEYLGFLPFVLIIGAAFLIVRHATSARVRSRLYRTFLWLAAIVVPVVSQAFVANMFHPNELAVTSLDWALMDNFRMQMSDAQFLDDVLYRTLGAIVGSMIVVLFVAVIDKRATSS